jgi:ATP-dependent Clp protease protease subunit
MAASMGAVLLCAGAEETFCITTLKSNDSPTIRRSTRVATDMEINLREMLKLKDELYNIISHHSGEHLTVHKDSERDYWMKADEAKEYGMIDEVLRRS